jgi:hypothetical protein
MKTRLLILFTIIIVGILISTSLVFNVHLSDIESFVFRQLPLMLQNNPISHSFVVADIKKTPEYQKFTSTFPIYDERIIRTAAHSMEYQVITIDNQTKNFLILYFNHYNNGKLYSNLYCSLDTPLDDANKMPDGSINREKVLRYVEITNCVENYE